MVALSLKYRCGGGPTFSLLRTGSSPHLGLPFLWAYTAQWEQRWQAQAGKAACLWGGGRWLPCGHGGGGRRPSAGKQMSLFLCLSPGGFPLGNQTERAESQWPCFHVNTQSQYILFMKPWVQCVVSGFNWPPNPLQENHNVNSYILIPPSASHWLQRELLAFREGENLAGSTELAHSISELLPQSSGRTTAEIQSVSLKDILKHISLQKSL